MNSDVENQLQDISASIADIGGVGGDHSDDDFLQKSVRSGTLDNYLMKMPSELSKDTFDRRSRILSPNETLQQTMQAVRNQ